MKGFEKDKSVYPSVCGDLTGIYADVDWNGALTVFYNPTEGDQRLRSFESEDTDGLLGSRGDMEIGFGKPSDGQKRVRKMIAAEAKLQANPDFAAKPKTYQKNYEQFNDTWRDAFDKYEAYIKGCREKHSADQRPTLLMDEPDRSLSIEGQCGFWCSYVPRLAKTAQVIIASHSPLSLFIKGANLVDLNRDFASKAIAQIERMVAGESIELPPESEESKRARAEFLAGLKD